MKKRDFTSMHWSTKMLLPWMILNIIGFFVYPHPVIMTLIGILTAIMLPFVFVAIIGSILRKSEYEIERDAYWEAEASKEKGG